MCILTGSSAFTFGETVVMPMLDIGEPLVRRRQFKIHQKYRAAKHLPLNVPISIVQCVELAPYCWPANFWCLESLTSAFAILSTFVWSVFAEYIHLT